MRGRARGWASRNLEDRAIRKLPRSAANNDTEARIAQLASMTQTGWSAGERWKGTRTKLRFGCFGRILGRAGRSLEKPLDQCVSEFFTRVFLDEMTRIADDLVGLAGRTGNARLQDLFGSGHDRIPVGE